MSVSVLVADDQELIRDGLSSILDGRQGLEVVGTARDGAEAVRRARELAPDVTLMDVRMPGTDGLEATRQLMADRPPPTRVVVLTTFDDDELVVEALRLGASGFLLKDLPRQRLVDAILAVHEGDLQLAPAITRRLVERHLTRRVTAHGLDGLTERERDVLRLVGGGATNTEIGGRLFISESTVKTHVGRLLQKLGVRDRVQLVILAHECGLVD